MSWAVIPTVTGSDSITMIATAASDPAGFEYYFNNITDSNRDSGWQSSSYYKDVGSLLPGTTYSYRVKARDMSNPQYETSWSGVASVIKTTTPLAFVAAGTVANGTSSSGITPALPSGIATGDILLLSLETGNEAISISNQNNGIWTEVTGSPQGTGTTGTSGTGTRLTVFWSRYNGTQGAPTTSDSGNHQLGRIIAVRGVTTSGNPWDVTAGDVNATSNTSGVIPGATTTVNNTLIVAAIATSLPDSTGTTNFSSWANSNLTDVTERTDNTVTSGNGGGLGIATGGKATAGAYGNTTVTLAASALKGMMSIALKPEAVAVNPPGQASSPSPAIGATGVSITTTLSWTADPNATLHDVYFGTVSPGTFQNSQTGTTFNPGTLASSTTYYWRIDEKNAGGTTTGTVWSFTTVASAQTFTLNYTAGAGGTLTGNTAQVVNYGANGTAVTAVPGIGYHFVNWSDASTANPRTDLNVTANIAVTANFAINTFTLNYTAGAGGTLTGNTAQVVNYGANGTAVTAVPGIGYHFVNWSDASTANPRTDLNVTANIAVTANFAINTFTLNYTAGAGGTLTGNTASGG